MPWGNRRLEWRGAFRSRGILALVAVLLAACVGPGAQSTTTSAPEQPTTTAAEATGTTQDSPSTTEMLAEGPSCGTEE
jgi:hypothetical protein